MEATDKAKETTLDDLQQLVDEWIHTYGVRYFDPLTNMAILTEETGEVARVMARLYGEQSAKASDHLDLADELADLLWVLTSIANQCGVNLQEALEKNLQKKTKRDATRHLNNSKLTAHPLDITEQQTFKQ